MIKITNPKSFQRGEADRKRDRHTDRKRQITLKEEFQTAEHVSKDTIHSEKRYANTLSKLSFVFFYNPRCEESIIYSLKELIFRYVRK